MVSGWCFLYGIFLYEKNHIELEDLHSARVKMRKNDSQGVVQHAEQRINICRGVRNRDHRHALILFAPPDTDVIVRLEHIGKNNRVFAKDGFVASEKVDLVSRWAGGLEDDVPVQEPEVGMFDNLGDDFDLEVSIHVCW